MYVGEWLLFVVKELHGKSLCGRGQRPKYAEQGCTNRKKLRIKFAVLTGTGRGVVG